MPHKEKCEYCLKRFTEKTFTEAVDLGNGGYAHFHCFEKARTKEKLKKLVKCKL